MSVKKLDLFDLDTKLMTSVGPAYKQQETSSRYCVANDNLCNVRRYCKLLMLQQCSQFQLSLRFVGEYFLRESVRGVKLNHLIAPLDNSHTPWPSMV
jgi:hypothetical protein